MCYVSGVRLKITVLCSMRILTFDENSCEFAFCLVQFKSIRTWNRTVTGNRNKFHWFSIPEKYAHVFFDKSNVLKNEKIQNVENWTSFIAAPSQGCCHTENAGGGRALKHFNHFLLLLYSCCILLYFFKTVQKPFAARKM